MPPDSIPRPRPLTPRPNLARFWPWILLAVAVVPAVWHITVFPTDEDGEYPGVVRPTFNLRPPSAYRLAEPGDTIDRVGLYLSVLVAVASGTGWWLSRRSGGQTGLWPSAIAIACACGWYAATPGPCYDGWHGLGWRTIANPSAPIGLRVGLALAALTLGAVLAVNLAKTRGLWRDYFAVARSRGAFALLILAVPLLAFRGFDLPGVEPAGYWPRWSFAWGVLAMLMAAIRLLPAWPPAMKRWRLGLVNAAMAGGLIAMGLWVTELHRPLERLRVVEPGRIFISAMPTYRGLQIEHERLKFKTIINLFDEATPQRSPFHEDEVRFAREHGIRYVGSPGSSPDSDAFLDESLALAQDPANWPVLVHCHGCMDRSPAWMGIYRFLVQGKPMVDILREIEAHRGVRPKATVTLLYNHVLPSRAPEAYANDPTAQLLQKYAQGVVGPYDKRKPRRVAGPNPTSPGSVPRR